jgi:hypothetical protein
LTIDLFLSHNSQDKALVREAAKALRERDVKVWFDEEDLVPGMPWITALENAIQDSAAVAVMIGGAGIGPWERPEMHAALVESVDRQVPIVPLLLPGAPDQPDLPLFLKTLTWVDCRDGFTEQALDRICKSVTVGRDMMRQRQVGHHEPVVRQDVTAKTKSSAKEMWSFFSDRKYLRNWLIKACLLLPVLLIFLGFAPPWATGTGRASEIPLLLISLIVEAIAFTSVFIFVGRWTNTDRLYRTAIGCCVASFMLYVVVFFSLTEPQPETRYRVFSGFMYSEEFKKVLPFYNGDYVRTKLAFGYESLRIYVPWTVTLAQLIVIICWFSFIGLFSFYLGIVAKVPALGQTQSKWSDDSLVTLQLPARIRRILYDSNIETVGDLCALNKRQLQEFTRMSAKQLDAVIDALARVGICLRQAS